MNFSTRIIISPDGKWGARDENGTWNGMIQTLQSRRAQLALTSLTILKSRSEVIDFSPSLILILYFKSAYIVQIMEHDYTRHFGTLAAVGSLQNFQYGVRTH